MSLIENKIMPCDDSCSQQEAMLLGLANRIRHDDVSLWSLIRTGENLTNFTYQVGYRTNTPSCAALAVDFVDGDVLITFDPAQANRVKPGDVVLLETGERVYISDIDWATGIASVSRRGQFADPAIVAPYPTAATGTTACIIGNAQAMCDLKGRSSYESTETFQNYVQKFAEVLEFCVDERCITRKFGITEQTYVQEEVEKMLIKANRTLYHGIPSAWCTASGFGTGGSDNFGTTSGVDYVIHKCGDHVYNAAVPGTLDINEIKQILEDLQLEGVRNSDDLVIVGSSAAIMKLKKAALLDTSIEYTTQLQPCSSTMVGRGDIAGICHLGLSAGLIVDDSICDGNIRFISLRYVSKHFFCNGAAGRTTGSNLVMIDEPQTSSQCVRKSLHMKFGTQFQNPCAHALYVTGCPTNACKTSGCDCGPAGHKVDCSVQGLGVPTV